jgi:hypothetical protein
MIFPKQIVLNGGKVLAKELNEEKKQKHQVLVESLAGLHGLYPFWRENMMLTWRKHDSYY